MSVNREIHNERPSSMTASSSKWVQIVANFQNSPEISALEPALISNIREVAAPKQYLFVSRKIYDNSPTGVATSGKPLAFIALGND